MKRRNRVVAGRRRPIRDVSLYVEVVGRGYPLVLMHGGPRADHWTHLAVPATAPTGSASSSTTIAATDGRRPPVSSMTWENLTADADALREALGFERWAVLGHSFGGHVALEYALRYPDGVSHLVLLDTGAEGRWSGRTRRSCSPSAATAREPWRWPGASSTGGSSRGDDPGR